MNTSTIEEDNGLFYSFKTKLSRDNKKKLDILTANQLLEVGAFKMPFIY
ncbi:hypothetical protein FHS90_001799 [Rufibacter quisquiliarum]|uniref:Uncharacterized protein n=1 Tax=Rufibacter quisquiliarum TaxID=1549639 RepID=A0A839GRQ0_9BACT|nr:hypothetical protein [Rufibacter quisquiliarum]